MIVGWSDFIFSEAWRYDFESVIIKKSFRDKNSMNFKAISKAFASAVKIKLWSGYVNTDVKKAAVTLYQDFDPPVYNAVSCGNISVQELLVIFIQMGLGF